MSHQFRILSRLYLRAPWFGAYFYFVIHGTLRVQLLASRSDTLLEFYVFSHLLFMKEQDYGLNSCNL